MLGKRSTWIRDWSVNSVASIESPARESIDGTVANGNSDRAFTTFRGLIEVQSSVLFQGEACDMSNMIISLFFRVVSRDQSVNLTTDLSDVNKTAGYKVISNTYM